MPTYCIALLVISSLLLLMAIALIVAFVWARRAFAGINHRLDESSRSHAACLVNIASQEHSTGTVHERSACAPRYAVAALQHRVKTLEEDRDAADARASKRFKAIEEDIVGLTGTIVTHQDLALSHDMKVTNLETQFECVADRVRIIEASRRPSAIPVPTLEQKLNGYQANMADLKVKGIAMGQQLDKQNAAIAKAMSPHGSEFEGLPTERPARLKEKSHSLRGAADTFNNLATKINGAFASPVKTGKQHEH